MPATTNSDKFLNTVPRWSGQVGAAGVSSTTATVIPLQSTTGLVNGRAYFFTFNRLTGTTKNPVSSTEGLVGVVNTSTNEITTTLANRGLEGAAAAWAAGTLVEILHSAGYMNRFIEGLEVSLNQDGTLKSTALDGTKVYAADAGSTDDYAITLAPAPSAYATGQTFRFKANTANTGAATLNVNSLGAKTIKKNYNSDLATGDILANQLVEVIYDGTNFQMLSPVAGSTTTVGADGWTLANETWTYASANTINVPSGAASKYAKGDKIRIKQGAGYKYLYVITVADTLLTVTGGSDYTVANSAITDNYYSHQVNPIGFPIKFSCAAPTWNTSDIDNGTGGQQPTAGATDFSIMGNKVSLRGAWANSNVFKNGAGATISTSALPATLPTNASFFNLPCGIANPGGVNATITDRVAGEFRLNANSSIADNTNLAYSGFIFEYFF